MLPARHRWSIDVVWRGWGGPVDPDVPMGYNWPSIRQLAFGCRSGGWPAHRLVGELLGLGAVEVGPVEDQLGRIGDRVPGHQLDDREEQLGTGAVAAVEDLKSHDRSGLLARRGP